jgi:hypothetical protein
VPRSGFFAGPSTTHRAFDFAIAQADIGQHALIERAEFANGAPLTLHSS